MIKRLDPQFSTLIAPHNIAKLDRQADVIYGTWADYRLAYINPAWLAFARENGGEPQISKEWTLGRSIRDAWPEILSPYWDERLQECLRSGKPCQLDYECSSPVLYREFELMVYPLQDARGLLFINSIRVETPHDTVAFEPGEPYVNKNGLIMQCAHCRRVQNQQVENRWDRVPALVATPAKNTSHALCEVCYAYYYPEVA